MTTHSSILAWKIPWTEELDRLQSMGLKKSQTQSTEWLSMHAHTPCLPMTGHSSACLFHRIYVLQDTSFFYNLFLKFLVVFYIYSISYCDLSYTSKSNISLLCHRSIAFSFLKGMTNLFSISIIIPREMRLQRNHILSKVNEVEKEKTLWKGWETRSQELGF